MANNFLYILQKRLKVGNVECFRKTAGSHYYGLWYKSEQPESQKEHIRFLDGLSFYLSSNEKDNFVYFVPQKNVFIDPKYHFMILDEITINFPCNNEIGQKNLFNEYFIFVKIIQFEKIGFIRFHVSAVSFEEAIKNLNLRLLEPIIFSPKNNC